MYVHVRVCVCVSYLSHLQEPHRVQGLLDIRHLILQAHHSSLEVLLHELVLGNQLLEPPQGGLDVRARRDIVLDLVDKGRLGDTSGVRGRGITVGLSERGSSRSACFVLL